MKTQTLFSTIAIFFCTSTFADEPRFYAEGGFELLQPDYDFDQTLNGARYRVDNRTSKGYRLQFGWKLEPNWQFFLKYTRHDNDYADGVILVEDARVQAPIFYQYEQAQLGVQYSLQLTGRAGLEAIIAYQEVDQSLDDFFVAIDGYSFGLSRSHEKDGWMGQFALRVDRGDWQLRPFIGYDPHAGMDVSVDDVDVESAWYFGGRVDYQFVSNWSVGLEAKIGETTDFSLLLRHWF